MRDLTSEEERAMREYMNREGFAFRMPEGFFDDIASEGIEDARAIFAMIGERLETLARLYRLKRPSMEHGATQAQLSIKQLEEALDAERMARMKLSGELTLAYGERDALQRENEQLWTRIKS